jgi:hypothetical protein
LKRFISMRSALVLLVVVGCDYSSPEDLSDYKSNKPNASLITPNNSGDVKSKASAQGSNSLSADEQAKRDAILERVITLIRTASLKPGGDNFTIATESLNQYFGQDALPVDYRMSAGARNFLLAAFDEKTVKGLESPTFDVRRDARHIEDCML